MKIIPCLKERATFGKKLGHWWALTYSTKEGRKCMKEMEISRENVWKRKELLYILWISFDERDKKVPEKEETNERRD